ncbi:acyl-CoA dehydrogenase family protein [Gordonia crocea]|uniref:Acyl-[acyl-carrier-protein] dehydrogenase MbtN n=1 Tax=Gordonia crocea TaxID=589162 RepID=A0A7M3SUR3_9ACTN|nr:acyl-CoA dehydrogenase family protein [Gordonia crocea]GED96387.1 acyl-CoA dehydrogenase [Gordonia crocea]
MSAGLSEARTFTEPLPLEQYRELLDQVFDDEVAALVQEAERTELFPRALLEKLGAAGVFRAKWAGATKPDVAKLFELGYRLGATASTGVGVGVSLHDSGIATLRRFGKSDYLKAVAERAIDGTEILCIGASEESGGSDLQIVGTEVSAETSGGAAGYRVRGRKKFCSLSPIAGHMIAVARSVDDGSTHGNNVVVAVPMDSPGVVVGDRYRKLSAGPLDTAPVEIDAWVPEEALIARPGTGLAVISWGLAHERLSVAAQVASACDLILGITLARMMDREQFGKRLYDHQALRLRVADLQARVDTLRFALDGIAAAGPMNLRTAAAIKVTSVRLAEEVAGECLHIFGGSGFLYDETPVGRWWRDIKLGRVGGGTDEVLWELVAAAMKPNTEAYQNLSSYVV